MSARPATPASPKNAKIKSPSPGNPVFGCGACDASNKPTRLYADRLPCRACPTSSFAEPRGHEQFYSALQDDTSRNLRYKPHHSPDVNEPGRSSRYLAHLELPMPTMSRNCGGSRSFGPWDRKTTSILYVTAFALTALILPLRFCLLTYNYRR